MMYRPSAQQPRRVKPEGAYHICLHFGGLKRKSSSRIPHGIIYLKVYGKSSTKSLAKLTNRMRSIRTESISPKAQNLSCSTDGFTRYLQLKCLSCLQPFMLLILSFHHSHLSHPKRLNPSTPPPRTYQPQVAQRHKNPLTRSTNQLHIG